MKTGRISSVEHDQSAWWSHTTAAVLAVSGLVFALYGRVLEAYLFEDDFQWLAMSSAFHPASIFDIAGHRHFYRPIIELYFYLGVRLFGDPTVALHLFSVVVHAVNGVLVYLFTRALIQRASVALAAALIFVSLPGYVDAVAWVGAIAEPLVTMFGVASVWWFTSYLRTGHRVAWAGAVVAFALALLTHESAVMILPLLVLAPWVMQSHPESARHCWNRAAASYAPFILLFAAYAVVAIIVSRNNYLVTGGQYTIGSHAGQHILDYIVSLYVGKKILPSYIAIVIALAVLLWRGSRPVRFAIGWMLLAMLPFAFFVAGNTSRYLYTPAVGFAMLMALGLSGLDGALEGRMSGRARGAVVGLLAGLIVCRFVFFAVDGVGNFVARTEEYRDYLGQFRTEHPTIAPGAIVSVPALASDVMHETYVEAMIDWEYRDATIRVHFGREDMQEH